jgi:uncharacterized metal-binding protein YceD (DUF177 family)
MSAPAPALPLLDASIRVDHLPPEGREVDVLATTEQRAAIADRLEISAVDHLDAKLSLTRFRGGMRVLGRLKAQTVQPCVITFVPVIQQIEEPIDRVFLPSSDVPKTATSHPEVFVDLDDDVPDHFEGNEVDLSELIIETLALALDPYPRAEGASLDQLGVKLEDDEVSPFAGLKSLIDPDDKA